MQQLIADLVGLGILACASVVVVRARRRSGGRSGTSELVDTGDSRPDLHPPVHHPHHHQHHHHHDGGGFTGHHGGGMHHG